MIINLTSPVAVKKPICLNISGTWSRAQYKDASVDPAGLVFTVVYSNGDTAQVSPYHSPTRWTTSGLQTVTFSYAERGFTVTATSVVRVSLTIPTTDVTLGEEIGELTFPLGMAGNNIVY